MPSLFFFDVKGIKMIFASDDKIFLFYHKQRGFVPRTCRFKFNIFKNLFEQTARAILLVHGRVKRAKT